MVRSDSIDVGGTIWTGVQGTSAANPIDGRKLNHGLHLELAPLFTSAAVTILLIFYHRFARFAGHPTQIGLDQASWPLCCVTRT